MVETPHASQQEFLAVNSRDREEIRSALVCAGKLQDLRWSPGHRKTAVGNIYLAEVRQVEPGLDAAFVDFGGRRAGFLHVGNVHPAYGEAGRDPIAVAVQESPTAAMAANADLGQQAAEISGAVTGIQNSLHKGQKILVQVLRDAVRGKGATLTTYLSLAGRLLVLMPSLGRLGISRRIQNDAERQRLRDLLKSCAGTEQWGWIARTAAIGATQEELQLDINHLLQQWKTLDREKASGDDVRLVLAEAGPAVRAVRDFYTPNLKRVMADDAMAATEIRNFLHTYAPGRDIEVQTYGKTRPLFEALDLERDYQLLFRAKVPVGSGASIVIHETEALTAIDVNSGRVDKGTLEETALAANLLAADEIARQIRLRDLGGIIVIDFIDMQIGKNRKTLEAHLRGILLKDRARLKIGKFASFGLVPLTRKRLGTGLPRSTEVLCGQCGGTGTLVIHHAGALRALRKLRAVTRQTAEVRVHPGVLKVLQEHHADSLESLRARPTFHADSQVPPGEPVLELP